jgi:Ras-related protein Rab-1A
MFFVLSLFFFLHLFSFRLCDNLHMKPECEFLFKIVLLGDSSVGKSSLLLRFVDNAFFENMDDLDDVEYAVKRFRDERARIIVIDGKNVMLRIQAKQFNMNFWEEIDTIPEVVQSLRMADGIMLVYDITDCASFKNLKEHLRTIDRYSFGCALKMIVGSKCDLVSQKCVDFLDAHEFAEEFGLPLLETSAKNSTNVDDAFVALVLEIMGSLCVAANNDKK